MKAVIAVLGTITGIASFFSLIFHLVGTEAYPGLFGVYFMKISPENALYTGIFAAISLFFWYILEIRDEKRKSESDCRFYDSYGIFK